MRVVRILEREERGDELILLEYFDIDLHSAVVLYRRSFP